MDKRILITVCILSVFSAVMTLNAQVNAPSKFPDRVILNLTEDPYTSVAVTWRTDISMRESYCEIQLSPPGPIDKGNSASFKATTVTLLYRYENEPDVHANHHSHVFTRLSPGKKYIYRVGNEDYWSEWYEFETPSLEDEGFSFIFLGDSQTDLKSQWSRVIRAAYRHEPSSSFILYGGDLINRAGKDMEWYEWFHAGSFIFSTLPQVMTPGNHEYRRGVLDPHWNAQFTLPANGPDGLEGTCYAIDYKNLKLVSLNSAVDSELRDKGGIHMEAQKVWLDSVLHANTQEWVIVTTHLPFYSPKENRDNDHLRENFQSILEKHNVDLVLSGHDHSYGRGRATDNPLGNHQVMYVVSVSGPKMYGVGDKDWMERSGADIQLYQIIEIKGGELRYKSYSADGKLFDQFELTK